MLASNCGRGSWCRRLSLQPTLAMRQPLPTMCRGSACTFTRFGSFACWQWHTTQLNQKLHHKYTALAPPTPPPTGSPSCPCPSWLL